VVKKESIKAVKALGLDFGAVDIATIKGTDGQECCIYEVNTACGMQGTTLEKYTQAIRGYLDGRD
jgi:glutathione synthase/RimK-type ligase-like ATP-grasp enzyme